MSISFSPIPDSVTRIFQIEDPITAMEPLGQGHINETYRVDTVRAGRTRSYVLQRINSRVFPEPELLIQNWLRVTRHLQERYSLGPDLPVRRCSIPPVPTRTGAPYTTDSGGQYWRCMPFIEETYVLQKAEEPRHAYEAASAFGQFQRDMADYPGPPLDPVLPGFHDIRKRYQLFEAALAADSQNRSRLIQPEISFLQRRRSEYQTIESNRETGQLPLRICHNDAKINNVLLDRRSGKGVAVIDLDTVMMGTPLYDFGDLGRSLLSDSTEDDTDLSAVRVRLDYFQAMTEGFYSSWGGELDPAETALLAAAPGTITLTLALRFLTDYLSGDLYFKTSYAGQNLDRTRNQIDLVRSLEKNRGEMEAIVAEIFGPAS